MVEIFGYYTSILLGLYAMKKVQYDIADLLDPFEDQTSQPGQVQVTDMQSSGRDSDAIEVRPGQGKFAQKEVGA